MTSYLLNYDEGMLGRFLEMQGVPWEKWGEPRYFFNGAPMFVNRKARIAQSCDESTIEKFASIHSEKKEVIIIN